MLRAYSLVQSRLGALRRDEKGVTAIEYGVIAAVIIVALVGVLGGVAGGLETAFNAVATALSGSP
jgi:pilus assembly protein Flp/PilA